MAYIETPQHVVVLGRGATRGVAEERFHLRDEAHGLGIIAHARD